MLGDHGLCQCKKCVTRGRHRFTYSGYIAYIRSHEISSTNAAGIGGSLVVGSGMLIILLVWDIAVSGAACLLVNLYKISSPQDLLKTQEII